jgi:hypothetical protein
MAVFEASNNWQHPGRGVANDAHFSRLLIADPVQENQQS